MSPLAQSLQPEAIGVLVVLGIAIASLVVAGVQLLVSRRRRRRRAVTTPADVPDPERFADLTDDEVIAAADAALYERDGRTIAAAALHLHQHDHVQAVPYLLHALRAAPAAHRPALLDAVAQHPRDALAHHPLLTAALDPEVIAALHERIEGTRAARSAP